MSSYVDTQLIECTRASSEQVKIGGEGQDDSSSLFTNKLGDSITLNSGDKVSVERTFINGLGSGNAETIQFKGGFIHQKVNKIIKYTSIGYLNKNDNPAINPYRLGLYNEISSIEFEEEIKDLRDNEVNFVMGYYLNCGDKPNYIQLPRRFPSVFSSNTALVPNIIGTYNSKDGTTMGNCEASAQENNYVREDWAYREGDPIGAANVFILKQRVDNSRYALYVRDHAYYDSTIDGANTYVHNRDDEDRLRVMAYPYQKYREKKTITVQKGFNTPESVATQLTKQLNKTNPPDIFKIEDPTGTEFVLTETVEAECYKPFNCASNTEMSSINYDKFIDRANPIDNDILNYLNSFFFMAVKRPEIYDAGSLLPQRLADGDTNPNPDGFKLLLDIPLADRNNANGEIVLDFEYTQENLLMFRDLFDAEALYPEELWDRIKQLIDYQEYSGEATISNTRFVHMNYYGEDINNAPAGITQKYLGSENNENALAVNKGSGALFIDYIPEDHDNYYEPDNIPPDHLTYGFGKSYLLGGVYYLKFRIPYRSDIGISSNFFKENSGGGNEIVAGRRIGFDWCSTAYSTAMIIPYSAYMYESFEGSVPPTAPSGAAITPTNYRPAFRRNLLDFNGDPKVEGDYTDIMKYATQTYIGANNPIVNYDSVSNRFQLGQFHTANNIGNTFNAGDPVGTSDNGQPIPIDDDASKVCYKINPRIQPFGYSPTFIPYTLDAEMLYCYPKVPPATDNIRPIAQANRNIEPFKIFDQNSGVYILDTGVNELEWGKSFWGILGFSYEQFNAEAKSTNVLNYRVGAENLLDLKYPTTNCEVEVSDTKSYISNEYGASQFTTQIPLPMSVRSYEPNAASILDGGINLYPFIAQLTQSVLISGKNLPKSMLNPFYTIRSDIISQIKYLGGKDSGIKMPIIAVVDRYGAEGDYYFGTPSDIDFTITKQTRLSDITTSIHDPDGSFALLNENSGVIYKIQRAKELPIGISQEILKDMKKKDFSSKSGGM